MPDYETSEGSASMMQMTVFGLTYQHGFGLTIARYGGAVPRPKTRCWHTRIRW